jgi:superfamily II DNA helicase RecQ
MRIPFGLHKKNGEDLWKMATSLSISMILVSPEQLDTKAFDRFITSPSIRRRRPALLVDEMHLIKDWGDGGFRIAYQQIGFALSRMPPKTVCIGVTATLPSADEDDIVKALGLKPGPYHFCHHSNIRSDVHLDFWVLTHSLSGWHFPDLCWVVEGKRKTIVYCNSINLAFHLFIYLWHLTPEDTLRCKNCMHLYTSLFLSTFNEETHWLFVEDDELQIIIATDALKVGLDFPNVADVVVLNSLNPNDIVQKVGCCGRQRGVDNPRGIVYFSQTIWQRAKKWNEEWEMLTKNRKGKRLNPSAEKAKWKKEGLTDAMVTVLEAACITVGLNTVYHNPPSEIPCNCNTCAMVDDSKTCSCSKCFPDPTANYDFETP